MNEMQGRGGGEAKEGRGGKGKGWSSASAHGWAMMLHFLCEGVSRCEGP